MAGMREILIEYHEISVYAPPVWSLISTEVSQKKDEVKGRLSH